MLLVVDPDVFGNEHRNKGRCDDQPRAKCGTNRNRDHGRRGRHETPARHHAHYPGGQSGGKDSTQNGEHEINDQPGFRVAFAVAIHREKQKEKDRDREHSVENERYDRREDLCRHSVEIIRVVPVVQQWRFPLRNEIGKARPKEQRGEPRGPPPIDKLGDLAALLVSAFPLAFVNFNPASVGWIDAIELAVVLDRVNGGAGGK